MGYNEYFRICHIIRFPPFESIQKYFLNFIINIQRDFKYNFSGKGCNWFSFKKFLKSGVRSYT